ncbi:MAG: DsrE/DsrF/DrsH-like family protein [Myxococcales bacterium]|nr:DsrE/DsrF/DrsH-like family protein [Myxococcota bacterium]MDW8280684.1 DsrE/DsrF/DrsH-like family protein [Myxococcales bacterium]
MIDTADPRAVAAQLAELSQRIDSLQNQLDRLQVEDRLAMVVFSGEFDRMMAALILASTAAASGLQVELFFTFWALAALRDPSKKVRKRHVLEALMGLWLPKGLGQLKLSRMNLGGAGPALFRKIMRQKGLASPEEMLKLCEEGGVKIYICETSRQVLGFQPEECIQYAHLDCCGAATFIERATRSRLSLFI